MRSAVFVGFRAALAAAAWVATSGAFAESTPKFPHGESYRAARSRLTALGWAPTVTPDADAWTRKQCGYEPGGLAGTGADGGDDHRCFPEVETCAGTGFGQCVYTWRRGATIIEVLTTGLEPKVQSTRCRNAC